MCGLDWSRSGQGLLRSRVRTPKKQASRACVVLTRPENAPRLGFPSSGWCAWPARRGSWAWFLGSHPCKSRQAGAITRDAAEPGHEETECPPPIFLRGKGGRQASVYSLRGYNASSAQSADQGHCSTIEDDYQQEDACKSKHEFAVDEAASHRWVRRQSATCAAVTSAG